MDSRSSRFCKRVRGSAPRIAVAGPLISTEAGSRTGQRRPACYSDGNAGQTRVRSCGGSRNESPISSRFCSSIIPARISTVSPDLVEVAIAESHRLGLRAAVHATELATAKAALAAGADILVHSVEDRRIDSEFLAMLKARNVIYMPTLMVTERYDAVFSNSVKLLDIERRLGDPDVIQSWGELARIPREKIPGGIPRPALVRSRPTEFLNLQLLTSADMRIAVGTDAGNIGTLHGPVDPS